MANPIQFRRGSSAQWSLVNPILAQGEPGFDTTVGHFKIGDGTSDWNSLPYFTDGSVEVTSVNGRTGAVVLTKSDVGLGSVPNTDATQRSNHTGTQTASTISDFNTAADARVSSGISAHVADSDPHPVYATDSAVASALSLKADLSQAISQLTGEVTTGTGGGSQAATVSNAAVLAKILTGLVETYGFVQATDSILTAIAKLAWSQGLHNADINQNLTIPSNHVLVRGKTNLLGTSVLTIGNGAVLQLL